MNGKMKKIKFLSIGLALLMGASVLAGCNADPSSSQGGSAASGTESAGAGTSTVTKADDLFGKRVGVQGGTTGDTYVYEHYTLQGMKELQAKMEEEGETMSLPSESFDDAELSRFNKITDAALDLKNGKLDAVVVDEMPAKKIVEANPDLKILDENLTEEEYSIAIQKGNTELTEKINAALAKLKENGTFDLLVAKWIDKDETAQLPEIPEYTPTGTIVMGTNAEFDPFEFHEDDGTIAGFDVDLSKYIAAELGMELKIEDMAFDSLISALQGGKVDFVAAGMTADPERSKNVDFSDSYYSASQVIIVKK